MKTIVMLMLVSMLMIGAAPAYAAEATQVWNCEMVDDISEEEAIAWAREWLKNAKKMEGGERLKAHIYFPVAVNATNETDALFVVTAPSFEEWGKFWDNYIDSPDGAETETRHQEKIICPDSALWESIKIK